MQASWMKRLWIWTPPSVSDIISKGGTILYTARCMEFTTPEGQQKGADICRKHGIDGIVVIRRRRILPGRGQALRSGHQSPSDCRAPLIWTLPCTDYTIGFDTAVNTAMEAIDKIRDTSTSHERPAALWRLWGATPGYIALWCGFANGAEDILLPERYDGDEQALINRVIEKPQAGQEAQYHHQRGGHRTLYLHGQAH